MENMGGCHHYSLSMVYFRIAGMSLLFSRLSFPSHLIKIRLNARKLRVKPKLT